MYSVMLVDDERILREGMRKFIPWEKHGFQVKFEASNGWEALNVIREHDVDLLFLDIRMPDMSGLELLARMKTRKQGLHVVILSGFNEFDYAREAMRYHVTDYLLKPVRTGEVMDLLEKIRHEKEQRETDRMVKPLVQMDWFRLANEIGLQKASASLCRQLSRSFGQSSFVIAMLPTGGNIDPRKGEELAHEYAALDGVEEVFAAEKPHFGFCFLIVLRPDRPGKPAVIRRDHWTELGVRVMNRYSELNALIYSPVFQQSHLSEYLNFDYLDGLRQQLFYSHERIVFSGFTSELAAKAYRLPDGFAQQMLELIASNDRIHAIQKLNDLYFSIRFNPVYDFRTVIEAYQNLFQFISGNIRPLLSCKDRDMDFWTEDRGFDQLQTLHEKACRCLDKIFQRLESRQRDTCRRLIREVTRYIHDHLAEPVLLADLAEHFHISAEYLSQLFKKEVGINFNQYLKQARMSKAKDILDRDCNIRIYELADQVGYHDPKHFSKVFREITGMTPKEYIETRYV